MLFLLYSENKGVLQLGRQSLSCPKLPIPDRPRSPPKKLLQGVLTTGSHERHSGETVKQQLASLLCSRSAGVLQDTAARHSFGSTNVEMDVCQTARTLSILVVFQWKYLLSGSANFAQWGSRRSLLLVAKQPPSDISCYLNRVGDGHACQ